MVENWTKQLNYNEFKERDTENFGMQKLLNSTSQFLPEQEIKQKSEMFMEDKN